MCQSSPGASTTCTGSSSVAGNLVRSVSWRAMIARILASTIATSSVPMIRRRPCTL
jgi:hypothetical protein